MRVRQSLFVTFSENKTRFFEFIMWHTQRTKPFYIRSSENKFLVTLEKRTAVCKNEFIKIVNATRCKDVAVQFDCVTSSGAARQTYVSDHRRPHLSIRSVVQFLKSIFTRLTAKSTLLKIN